MTPRGFTSLPTQEVEYIFGVYSNKKTNKKKEKEINRVTTAQSND